MPLRRRAVAASLAFAAALCAAPQARAECALALILALDVSGSVDPGEWNLQRGGLASAFRTDDLQEAIAGIGGDLAVAVTQWTGASRQHVSIGWTRLTSPADVSAFADTLDAMPRRWRHFSTAIGEALIHAVELGRAAPPDCRRKVIDVSGDGESNEGVLPGAARASAAAEGWTVNGLAIAGAFPPVDRHYERSVIIGDLAFVEIADGFEDYPRAILRKLLREIRADMNLSDAPPPPAPSEALGADRAAHAPDRRRPPS
ncbi:MAG: DUF1194 domain-containing protein [Pseudomonadota bacterium]